MTDFTVEYLPKIYHSTAINEHVQAHHTSHFMKFWFDFHFACKRYTCMTKLIQFDQSERTGYPQHTPNSICIICIHERTVICNYITIHDLSETVFEPPDAHFWDWNAKSHHKILSFEPSNTICEHRH